MCFESTQYFQKVRKQKNRENAESSTFSPHFPMKHRGFELPRLQKYTVKKGLCNIWIEIPTRRSSQNPISQPTSITCFSWIWITNRSSLYYKNVSIARTKYCFYSFSQLYKLEFASPSNWKLMNNHSIFYTMQ